MNKVAFVFPGQGSQYIGMGKDIFKEFQVAREIYNISSEVLGIDLRNIIDNGSAEVISATENTQPIVFTTSIAMLSVFKEMYNLRPYIAAGHSLGEITALTSAGAINFEDAIEIVKNRSLFMKQAESNGSFAMYAIRNLHYKTVEEVCDKFDYQNMVSVISNYNSVDQVVISGHEEALNYLKAELEKKGATSTKLKVSGAFHSPIMKDASIKLKNVLKKYKFNKFEYPVISNVTGNIYGDSEDIVENLSNQMIMPVQWSKTVRNFEKMGIDTAVEIGGGKVLTNLIKTNSQNIKTYNMEKISDLEKFRNEYKNIDSNKELSLVDRCISISVCTKNNNFNNVEYEKYVINEHKKLYELQSLLQNEERELTDSEKKETILILSNILKGKNVSKTEIDEKVNELTKKYGISGELFNERVI
jgi:[acyl-carrier-protein] S-malonyltransferase